jgi:hypothetical protein
MLSHVSLKNLRLTNKSFKNLLEQHEPFWRKTMLNLVVDGKNSGQLDNIQSFICSNQWLKGIRVHSSRNMLYKYSHSDYDFRSTIVTQDQNLCMVNYRELFKLGNKQSELPDHLKAQSHKNKFVFIIEDALILSLISFLMPCIDRVTHLYIYWGITESILLPNSIESDFTLLLSIKLPKLQRICFNFKKLYDYSNMFRYYYYFLLNETNVSVMREFRLHSFYAKSGHIISTLKNACLYYMEFIDCEYFDCSMSNRKKYHQDENLELLKSFKSEYVYFKECSMDIFRNVMTNLDLSSTKKIIFEHKPYFRDWFTVVMFAQHVTSMYGSFIVSYERQVQLNLVNLKLQGE